MKRLCIVTHDDWDEPTGVARILKEVAPRLSRFFQVTVLVTTSQSGLKASALSPSLELIQIPCFRVPSSSIRIPSFSKLIKQHVRQSDLVFVQTVENAYALFLARRFKKPFLLYFHGLDWENFVKSLRLGKLSFLVLPLMKSLWNYWYRRANHVCLPSRQFAIHLEQAAIKTPRSVVPVGIDPNRFLPAADKSQLRASLGLPPSHYVIGYLGRQAPEKNLDLLLKVFSNFHRTNEGCRLLVVGSDYPEYKRQMKTHSGILAVGYQQDVLPYLQAMDVFCHPSPSETSALVTMEAMACGVVPVANAVGCMREYVRHGENGFLVDPIGDEEQFCNYLTQLMQDEVLREEMSRKARQTMVNYFNWDDTTSQLRDVLDRCLV
jgi:glycosyltransferase involved in cell wall biosynthesis